MLNSYPHPRASAAQTIVLATITAAISVNAPRAAAEPEFHAQWFDRVFAESPAAVTPQNRLVLIKEGAPGDTKIGRCSAGGPLRLGQKVYQRGIGVNSYSVLRVTLTKPAARLLADIGMDRNVDGTAASSAFHILVAGKDVFATKVLRPADGMQKIDVPLGGARQFDLIADEGGDGRGWDQGDWADAQVVLDDGSRLWLDDLAREASVGDDLPFSFVYGGKPSGEFLGKWRRAVVELPSSGPMRGRTLTLTDPATGLEVRAEATLYLDTPAVEWTLYFTNKGNRPTPVIERVKAVDSSIKTGLGRDATLHRLVGSPCRADDWLPLEDAMAPGKPIEFAPSGGRSSSGACPFFNVQYGGGGVITAIGWSGQWVANVGLDGDGALHIAGGLQSMHLRLAPRESIRGPRIMQLYWFGDDLARAYNQFRRVMLAHVVPKIAGSPVAPPIVHLSTSFYEMNASTEANVLAHLDSIKGLGFEVFWLDAYWTRGGFPDGMGNYGFPLNRVEPPDRFPRGLRPIGDAAAAAGMGFLVWFEPERVAAGTHIAKEHPDWVISPSGDGSGHINLGIPAAREYLTKYLIAVVRQYRLAWLRIDYNIDPLGFWQFLDKKDPDRVGMAEIRYLEGLYRMWDDVLAACPQLAIDNCASGGRRIDLETCTRSIPLWRTDATIDPLMANRFEQAALQNQVMTAGLGRYVPLSTSGQMGVTPYLFRSGFNAGISFCEDCRPGDYPRESLRQAIAEGKRIRKYYLGDYYPLSEVTTNPKDWCVLQYDRPAQHDGMVVAFRRHQSPYAAYAAELRAIDPAAEYDVTRSPGFAPSPPQRMKGEQLRRLRIDVDDRPGSMIVEYCRVGK
jgi:alpha-galactosidase